MTDEYEVPAEEIRFEIEVIKGSRFLATVAPVTSVEEAEAFVERIRTARAGATHNCWAWRVGPTGETFRSSDDGEPGGSAGRPMLRQIEGHGLTNTAVVVTRWYGGVKLGVGGLMRAYGGATGQALDRVARRTVVVTRRVALEYPYDCSGAVEGFLAAHRLAPLSSDYGASVRLVFELPEREVESLARELRDRTADRARMIDDPLPPEND
jgi:uncharacterized YigZ family protein